jgi:hypothetical protein
MHNDEAAKRGFGAVTGGRTLGAKATATIPTRHELQTSCSSPSTSTRLIVSRHVATSYSTGLEWVMLWGGRQQNHPLLFSLEFIHY